MNQTTHIESHIERMSAVRRFIENRLDEKMTVSELAAIACYSEFHFHRLFRAHFGESVYAFQKRLLLERAVKQLSYSSKSITDIALDAGYDNSSSFNKAFFKCFAHTPSQVRANKLAISASEQTISSELKVKTMEATIKQTDPIDVICARATGNYQKAAEDAWSTLMPFGYGNKLMDKATQLFGITYDDPAITDPDKIRYDACISVNQQIELTQGLEHKTIEGGRHAVFIHKGPHSNLAASYAHIFNQWLPDSGCELRDSPCFERYLNRDPRRTKPENLRTEIYVPLKA